MAKQNINIGSSANKGDGDPLRTAFTKINSNFTELYDRAVNTDAQTLTLVGNTLAISGGNSVSLSQYSTFSGSYNDLTNKPTIPSLGNIVFDANGITNPTGEIIDIQAPLAQLQSTDGTYIWVEDGYGAGIEVTYVGGSRIWKFDSAGALTFPDAAVQITAYTGPQTSLDGDVTGSVFADDSTLLVDGVAGKIVGEVDNNNVYTNFIVSQDGISQVQIGDGNTSGGKTVVLITEYVRILSAVPSTSIGVSGDYVGSVAFDSTYMYYCTQNHNGVTNIWKRVAWSSDTW